MLALAAPAGASNATSQAMFVRRTALYDDEYRVNFKQLDNDVIATLVSPAARAVTPLMSTIYLSLLAAPPDCWEREGVLRFVGESDQRERLTAWQQLRQLTGVANSTLAKALQWLHEQSIIGYVAHKNGVGIRIFLNRAAASIRLRATQKNLRLVPAPSNSPATPFSGTAFKEKTHEENRENNYSAQTRGQITSANAVEILPNLPIEEPNAPTTQPSLPKLTLVRHEFPVAPTPTTLTAQVVEELKPEIQAAAKREMDSTKDWLLKFAIPKATRVAQRETFDLLRTQGMLTKRATLSPDIGGNHHTTELEKNEEGCRTTTGMKTWATEFEQLAHAPHLVEAVQSCCRLTSVALTEWLEVHKADNPGDWEELDELLRHWEAALTDALWKALSPSDQQEVEQGVRKEMRPYAAKMDELAFRETIQRRVGTTLFERAKIPRLGVFFL